MKSLIKRIISKFIFFIASPLYLLLAIAIAIIVRIKQKNSKRTSIVWGSTPIINNSYWSRAIGGAGYSSVTFTDSFYSVINKREDWDRILSEEYGLVPTIAKPFIAFLESLFLYDIFFIPFSGFFIGNTPLWWAQAQILKLAGKKIVVMPYGGDSYIYQRIRSTSLLHALLMSYPQAARSQKRISRDVDYWCRYADVAITGLMGPDGFGRWDVLSPSPLSLDLEKWPTSDCLSSSDGKNGTVRIAHAPNHRGFKGTEFIIDAVLKLQQEGLLVDLVLLEKLQNIEVQKYLQYETDILIEQVIFGHGLNALEGLASGLPVISNLEDENYTLPFRRWSYLNECPIVSASPETLVDTLRKLVTRPELRQQLGKAGRAYAEKYQGLDSAQYLFGEVIEYLYGRRESLINLYHPLLGEYPNRKPKIDHPLVNNRIVD